MSTVPSPRSHDWSWAGQGHVPRSRGAEGEGSSSAGRRIGLSPERLLGGSAAEWHHSQGRPFAGSRCTAVARVRERRQACPPASSRRGPLGPRRPPRGWANPSPVPPAEARPRSRLEPGAPSASREHTSRFVVCRSKLEASSLLLRRRRLGEDPRAGARREPFAAGRSEPDGSPPFSQPSERWRPRAFTGASRAEIRCMSLPGAGRPRSAHGGLAARGGRETRKRRVGARLPKPSGRKIAPEVS